MSEAVIAIVGGGSGYTPGIVASLFRYPEVFADGEVRLHDLNTRRAEAVGEFCRRLAQSRGFPLTVTVTAEPDAALDGADFVHTTFRIGGVRALNLDQTLPRDFGYAGNETSGPGGLFMAMRTVPVIVDVARRMERCCPGAWLVNFANPTNLLQDAVLQVTATPMLSLCDGFVGAAAHVAMCLALPADEKGFPLDPIETRHAGLNHFGWAYEVRFGERDLLAELAALDEATFLRNIDNGNTIMHPMLVKGWRLFKRFGLFPLPLAHIIHEFFYAEHLREQLADRAFAVTDPARLQARWNRLEQALAEFDGVPAAVQCIISDGQTHTNLVVDVMAAIAADSGRVLAVNTPNRGAIAGLPDDTIVELHARVGRTGVIPVEIPALPRSIIALLQILAAFEQLAVEGILEKNTDKLLEALTIHPHTTSPDQAERVFGAMWAAQIELLGDYWQPGAPPLRQG